MVQAGELPGTGLPPLPLQPGPLPTQDTPEDTAQQELTTPEDTVQPGATPEGPETDTTAGDSYRT